MMQISLDHSRGGASLYVQLADALQEYIRAEAMSPGDLIPSENVLAKRAQLSRATVIKAFDLLVERGRVVRRQGKGTFVSSPPMQRVLPEFTSFSEHVTGLGMTPGNELLSFTRYIAAADDRPDSPFADEETIIVFERLRLVDGASAGLHRTIVSAELADRIGLTEISAADPAFSFYDLLRRYAIFPTTGDETLRAVNCTALDAEALKVDEGTALMEAVRESRAADGSLIEAVRARYIGSQYLYHVQLAAGVPTETSVGGGRLFAESLPA